MNKFSVEIRGSFYTFEIYDSRGREIFDASEAANEAEKQYGDQWVGVFNGSESIDRDDWKVTT